MRSFLGGAGLMPLPPLLARLDLPIRLSCGMKVTSLEDLVKHFCPKMAQWRLGEAAEDCGLGLKKVYTE